MPELAAAPAAAPVIKWVGGKTRLLPELVARAPASFGRYYEPFAGGAALFFRLAPERAVIADTNADLVTLYRELGHGNAEAVIRFLERYRDSHAEYGADFYYGTRARWNDPDARWAQADRAAAFVYLNKTCFNGLWRVNRKGEFNVPMGRYVDPPICAPEGLRAAAAALARPGVCIRCADYQEVVAEAIAGDFLYFDPPYDPISASSSFTSYASGGFRSEDQAQLAITARALVARGCQVMLSNSDTPFIRSLYEGLRIEQVRCGRAINSDTDKRGDVDELVITGGY